MEAPPEGTTELEIKGGDMDKAGLYAEGLLMLLGVLILGVGFVPWERVRDRSVPLPALAD
jgi:hypothetical protein